MLSFATAPSISVASDTPEPCLKLGADKSVVRMFPNLETVFADIYKSAGLCAVSLSMSAKRVEQMAMSGALDGHWLRVEGYAKTFDQTMVTIPVPLLQVDATFLSMEGTDFGGTVKGLKGLRVGYQSGFRWLEKRLSGSGAQLIETPYGVPIKDLLQRGRFDVFSTDSARAQGIIDDFSNAQVEVRIHRWKTISFYHLLAQQHADKVDALSEAITAAIADGAFDEIYALPGVNAAPLH